MASNAEPYHIARSKQDIGQMDATLGADETVNELCKDMIAHYEDRVLILEGKAMIVTYSRTIAMKIYKKLLELRPRWTEKLTIVMTRNNRDPEEWFNIIGGKKERDERAGHFKKPKDP